MRPNNNIVNISIAIAIPIAKGAAISYLTILYKLTFKFEINLT